MQQFNTAAYDAEWVNRHNTSLILGIKRKHFLALGSRLAGQLILAASHRTTWRTTDPGFTLLRQEKLSIKEDLVKCPFDRGIKENLLWMH